MDNGLDLSPGSVVVAAYAHRSGVFRVEGRRERDGRECVTLTGRSETLHVFVDDVPRVLRVPVSPERARRWLDALRGPTPADDDRPAAVRFQEHQAALLDGQADRVVEMLHRLYASRYTLDPAERRFMILYEWIVLGEIAHVLGVPEESLTEELHAAHAVRGAFAPDAPDRQGRTVTGVPDRRPDGVPREPRASAVPAGACDP